MQEENTRIQNFSNKLEYLLKEKSWIKFSRDKYKVLQ